jgi:PhoH-like ATPase
MTYVLDTSVLIADPRAIFRFAEHEIVLPLTVIGELEGKRDHPELGYFARTALRSLDDLRVEYGRLDAPIKMNEVGGTLHVELNHADLSALPPGFVRDGSADSRILAVAANLATEGKNVVLVSKDLPLRVKAASIGLTAEEYRAELAPSSGWTGMAEVEVSGSTVDALYEQDRVDVVEAHDLPCHTGVVLISERGSALGRSSGSRWTC